MRQNDLSDLDLIVPDDLAGQRLDRALASLTGLSRTRVQESIKSGAAQVDGKPARASQVLEARQRITMAGASDENAAPGDTAPGDTAPAADDIPLRIRYEDDYLLVVDKPAGMVTHPAPGHLSGTLVNALLAHAPQLAGVGDHARPGIVHRLDKDTSGLLVVAKDPATHAALARQMKDHAMVKRYLALVEGAMPTTEGVIDAPIGRDPRQRLRMGLLSVASGGREARTRFRTLEEHGGRSLLEVQLETGRTHQIRVHLAAVHHPVVGDPVYGRAQRPLPSRQFLHAAHLEFRHPATGEWLTFDAPLPDDLTAFLAAWRGEGAR
jgi:23S rRNA pseudouridine1911/1915/1917 synthase